MRGQSTGGPVPLTLQEAMAKGAVRVHETGNVSELAIENLGEQEIFVQSGDIVKGGKQDRALVASLIVGVVWALWHVPKYLTAGDPHDLPFWFFALNMLASAILYTWVFNCTGGSLLLVLLLPLRHRDPNGLAARRAS